MSRLILLDSGPLGLASNPRISVLGQRFEAWVTERVMDGDRLMIPEIVDYEVRRELLRAGKTAGVARLDALGREWGLLPSGGSVLIEAAELWARARNQGYPTADDRALDGDVILAASAVLASREGFRVLIATDNVNHLARFADARPWASIGSESP